VDVSKQWLRYSRSGSTKTRHNEVVNIAKAFIHRAELDQAINDLRPELGPDVVDLTYTLGEDWSGEPAIFFRIVLSDRAARRDQLYKLTSEIQNMIVQHIEPLEQWGVLPYFSYRSQAEQAVLQTAPWP
jgi:hypothetical protein